RMGSRAPGLCVQSACCRRRGHFRSPRVRPRAPSSPGARTATSRCRVSSAAQTSPRCRRASWRTAACRRRCARPSRPRRRRASGTRGRPSSWRSISRGRRAHQSGGGPPCSPVRRTRRASQLRTSTRCGARCSTR
ncbi:unnamed protein product, partial [Prorocentrum cordatum]